MKKNFKLPTFLGVLILVLGVIAGVFLINSQNVFKIGAESSPVPKNVRITNVTEQEISITWTTDIESFGFIKYGKTSSSITKIVTEENSQKSLIHTVTITALSPNTDIFIKINSNNKDYDNNSIPWQATTNSTQTSDNQDLTASGMILSTDGVTPAKAIVYININGTYLSDTTSLEGNYIIPVSKYLNNINETTVIEIIANNGIETSQATIYPSNIKSMPVMILGKTYDFKSLKQTTGNEEPKSSLSIPQSIEISSRFEVTKVTQTASPSKVNLDSISEGETITTINPEIFGKAPAKAKLEIQIESELQTATVIADSKGIWNWSPPNGLEQGEHKITIKWVDTNGMIRTLTRNFIVNASEGPAFEASSSATLKPSPTVKPTTKPTASSTSIPTPETGSLTPTLGLFIMGIGILLSSILVYKKSYV